MASALPSRLVPAILMATAIMFFTPTALMADAAVPFISFNIFSVAADAFGLTLAGLIPVVIVEAFVLRRRLGVGTAQAFRLASRSNITSTVVGLLLLFAVGVGAPHYYLDTVDYLPLTWSLLMAGLFLISVLVEFAVNQRTLSSKAFARVASGDPHATGASKLGPPAARSTGRILRSTFEANLASYLGLSIVVGVMVTSQVQQARIEGRPWMAAGALRQINVAEANYLDTYKNGFSPSLDALSGPASCPNPTAQAACLIDPGLTRNEKSRYTFVYMVHRDENGKVDGYSVQASPTAGQWHGPFYYTDQTGVTRWNADRPATAQDSPIPG